MNTYEPCLHAITPTSCDAPKFPSNEPYKRCFKNRCRNFETLSGE